MRLFLFVILIGCYSSLSTQAARSSQKKKSSSEELTRTLRLMIVANHPLPVFKKKGKKYIEENPPLSLIPPSSFSFANPSDAPKVKVSKDKASRNKKKRKITYSLWMNELLTLENYKGSEFLDLKLSRPFIAKNKFQSLQANLQNSINPLILIHANFQKGGWQSPEVQVIDWDPVKHPAGSVLLVNYSKHSIEIFYGKKKVVVSSGNYKHLRPDLQKKGNFRYQFSKDNFRYKLLIANGKEISTLANSQYSIDHKKDRLLMIVLSKQSQKNKKDPLPTLRILSDPIEKVEKKHTP